MMNQAKKVAKMEIATLKKETTEIANSFGNQAIKSGEGMNSEQLWRLVEAMMTELASEKAKNATLSKELGRFKKVAFNLYVSE